MKYRLSIILPFLLSLSILLSSCGYERITQTDATDFESPYASTADSGESSGIQKDFDQFCMDVFQREMITADTIDLHYTLTQPDAYGICSDTISLGTYSLSEMVRDSQDQKALRSRLQNFDREQLSVKQQVTYDALLETLNASLLSEGMELYRQPLAPTIGIQAQLPILLAEYAFHSLEDVEIYLALLTQTDRYYQEILAFEMQKADAGLAPSDASIDSILSSCKGYLINPENNFLTETFSLRLDELISGGKVSLTDEQISELENRHAAAIREHFIPAYQILIDGMSQLKGRGLNDAGLCHNTGGKEYYEYLVRSGSGLSYTVPELKNALICRMEKDYQEIRQLYIDHPDLNDQILNSRISLTDPMEILSHLQTQMSGLFPELERCAYEVRYVPKQLEECLSPAFYLTAPLDNTNQNIIYINAGSTNGPETLYPTLAHEGFPGHLYQTVYHRIHASSPLLSILSSSGTNEGWAVYVENYSYTMDSGLPEAVGRYHTLIRSFTLCSQGIMDIGINYEGWNMEQAKAFITSCFQLDDSTIHELWQTMIDNPANYLDYCGGYVEIMEMREQAQLVLGDRFSPLEFHQFLLDMGPVPLSVIRSHFQIWLDNI